VAVFILNTRPLPHQGGGGTGEGQREGGDATSLDGGRKEGVFEHDKLYRR